MKRWRTDGLRAAASCLARWRFWLCAAAGHGRMRARGVARQGADFSRAKLERVSDLFRNEVAAGKIPGAILLIQQHGHPVYFENFGVRDVENRHPMTADTIFRLYSMSKPITSVAAMMLVEDGKLSSTIALSKYIPDFADVKVGVEKPKQAAARRWRSSRSSARSLSKICCAIPRADLRF